MSLDKELSSRANARDLAKEWLEHGGQDPSVVEPALSQVEGLPQDDITTPPPLTRYEFVDAHMATLFRIVLFASSPSVAEAAADAAFEQVALMNRVFSDYDPTSETRRLMTEPPGRPVPVSRELFLVLSRAETLARASAGAFDVTIGPAVSLWRRARQTRVLPTPEEREEALGRVGYRHLALNLARRTVALNLPRMQLDFGGIAKGAAADAALAELKRRGVGRALVEGGGDLAIGDPPPDADGWRIGSEDLPDSPACFPHDRLWANCGVSTSGGGEQYVEIAGVRYAHIVDPRSGLGMTERRQVTIRAPTATDSDALATALYVLGAAEGGALIAGLPGTEAWIDETT